MAGWYELGKSKDGQFRFVLKAGNNEVILSSDLYKTRASAENGMGSVQANSSQEDRFEKKDAANGKFFFNLKAANHQIIGTSQVYASSQSRDNGILSVRTNSPSQSVKGLA